jgi:hypothetical protein
MADDNSPKPSQSVPLRAFTTSDSQQDYSIHLSLFASDMAAMIYT